jgi:HAD superfamily hydrolase (TIGR01509 family)
MLDALIFDFDGTLADTNTLHARAFVRAFGAAGYRVGLERIAREIGRGGDRLVPAILGVEAAREVEADVLRDHGVKMRRLLETEGAQPLPGAAELLREVRRRGLRIAVATAAQQRQLDAMQEATGMDLSRLADAVVTSSDVDATKPAPDTLTAALAKLDLPPERCGFVGDTPFDAAAARRAGLAALGIATEAHSAADLRASGLRAVFAHPRALLDDLDRALDLLSPGPHVLSRSTLDELMRQAMTYAQANLDRGEVPIGAVVATYDGQVLGGAANDARARGKVAHAEIAALLDAGPLPRRGDLVLVTTLEPCTMCLGAAIESGIDTVVYALEAPGNGGVERVETPPARQFPRVVAGVQRAQSRDLMVRFADAHPRNAFAAALVASTA